MNIRHWLLCSAALGALGAACAGGAQAAQTTAAGTAAAESVGGIETVVVTARKRSESIQSAPVAVTALDDALIMKRFVHDLTDLNHEAPNMQIEGVGAIH